MSQKFLRLHLCFHKATKISSADCDSIPCNGNAISQTLTFELHKGAGIAVAMAVITVVMAFVVIEALLLSMLQ